MSESNTQPAPTRGKILAISHTKGGVSKTTTSVLVAWGLQEIKGIRTALLDADSQSQAQSWIKAAPEDKRLAVDVFSMAGSERTLLQELERLSLEYDAVIVDLPNSLSERAPMSCLMVADAVISPTRAAAPDLRAILDTISIVTTAQRVNSSLRHFVIVTMYRRTKTADRVIGLLHHLGTPLMRTRIGDRTSFQIAAEIGSVPQMMGSAHRVAAEEVASALDEIWSILFEQEKQ